MNQVKQWLLLDPLDTLFFRGSESMVAGEDHEVHSVFPPMPETLVGAIRTAIMIQRCIRPKDFTRDGGPPPEMAARYPFLGTVDQPGFELMGPLFTAATLNGGLDWLLPVPAHWFADLSGELPGGDKLQVTVAEEILEAAKGLGVVGSVGAPLWVKNPAARELKSLSGFWTTPAAFLQARGGSLKARLWQKIPLSLTTSPSPPLLSFGALFVDEVRVGIALEEGLRRTKSGHLYAATHARLREGVHLAVGLSQELVPHYLNPKGTLQLGGEQRVVRYELLTTGPELPAGPGPWAISLSPFPYGKLQDCGWEKCPRASGPLIRQGGWDMKKQFHKPMRAFLPTGAAIKAGEGELPFGFVRL